LNLNTGLREKEEKEKIWSEVDELARVQGIKLCERGSMIGEIEKRQHAYYIHNVSFKQIK